VILYSEIFARLISFASTEVEDKPIKSLDIQVATSGDAPSPIPRKIKVVLQTNGHHMNGNASSSSSSAIQNGSPLQNHGGSTKRPLSDTLVDGPLTIKKTKLSNGPSNEVIVLDDDGAILIDD
jgi:hypothetical protein